MPLSVVDLQTPKTVQQVKDVILAALVAAEFPVEAWQDNGAARSFIEAQGAVGAEQTATVAEIAKMAFLKTAVNDFVDHLLVSHYDEVRQSATKSKFNVSLINQGSTTHGPVAAGAITVKASNAQTFSSTGIETITASGTTTVEVEAVFTGSSGNISAQTLELVTPFAGVICTFDGTLTTAGTDVESDPRYKERGRTKWGTLRVERVLEGFRNLARNAAPAVISVGIDDDNPRGPGTSDIYCAAENATAGGADVALVQSALDLAVMGNGSAEKLVLAIAAPTQVVNIACIVYYSGVNDTDLRNGLEEAWLEFLASVPLGGFDFSPGPANLIMASQIDTVLKAVPGVLSIKNLEDITIALNTKAIEGTMTFTRVPVNV